METQGSVGAQNALTPEEIAAADLVLIAADTQVDLSRFGGKRVFLSPAPSRRSTAARRLVARAFAEAQAQGGEAQAAAASRPPARSSSPAPTST